MELGDRILRLRKLAELRSQPWWKSGYEKAAIDKFISALARETKSGRDIIEQLSGFPLVKARGAAAYRKQDVLSLRRQISQLGLTADSAKGGVPERHINSVSISREVIELIYSARFRVSRDSGYSPKEVDAFLDALIETIRRAGAVIPELRATNFSRARHGYETVDVDQLRESILRLVAP